MLSKELRKELREGNLLEGFFLNAAIDNSQGQMVEYEDSEYLEYLGYNPKIKEVFTKPLSDIGVDKYFKIKPIKLTKEWFNRVSPDESCEESYHDDQSTFTYTNGGNTIEAVFRSDIQVKINNGYRTYVFDSITDTHPYLHQLQNLYFALTGEELKIKTG